MKPFAAAFLALAAAVASADPPEGVTKGEWKGGRYLVEVPPSYQPAESARWGLWVTMIPHDHEADQYDEVWEHEPSARSFVSLVVDFKVPMKEAPGLIAKVVADYGLRSDRVWMAGYAEGAPRAWDFAFRNPTAIAALAIFQGFPPAEMKESAKGIPVMLLHDAGCTYVPIATARGVEKKAKDAGYEVTFTELRRRDGTEDDWPRVEHARVLDWAQRISARRGEAMVRQAKEHLEAGRAGAALTVVEAVQMQGLAAPYGEELTRLQNAIDQAFQAKVARATEALGAGQVDEATKIMAELEEEYRGTGKATAVVLHRNKLTADPKFKEALEAKARERAEEAAKPAVEAARKLEGEKKWKDAIAAWKRVGEDHAGTEAAKEALARAAELENDPAVKRALADEESAAACRKLMQMGDGFAKNKLWDKARAKYQEVIDKYPATSFAEEAKKKIEAIQ